MPFQFRTCVKEDRLALSGVSFDVKGTYEAILMDAVVLAPVVWRTPCG